MIHQLKCRKEYFGAIMSGNKKFEVRKDDRGFQVGDFLALNECVHDEGRDIETGRCMLVRIVYILNSKEFCKEGYVIICFDFCDIKTYHEFVPMYFTRG